VIDCSGRGTCRSDADGPTCDCMPGFHHAEGTADFCREVECDLLCIADSPSTPDARTDADADIQPTDDAEAESEAEPEADADADAEPDVPFPTACTGLPDLTPCTVETTPDRSYDVCVEGLCVSPGCGDASCNTPCLGVPAPDTDQRTCYDAAAELDCASLPAPDTAACHTTYNCGQDAQHGWDTTHAQTERYTFAEPVAGEPVVTDTVTRLVWQWCPIGQGGWGCSAGSATAFTWSAAVDECENLALAGADDWRLPDRYELFTILDFGSLVSPAIDADAFPGTPAATFWSSTTYAPDASLAWYVDFEVGSAAPALASSAAAVRCVRGGAASGPRFVRTEPVTGQVVVIDNIAGLRWQGCTSNESGPDCALGGPMGHDWVTALQACEQLDWAGSTDWRLPNIQELAGLANARNSAPAIDGAVFPNTAARSYWSSTTVASNPSSAWTVTFGDGSVNECAKSGVDSFTRCVRDAP